MKKLFICLILTLFPFFIFSQITATMKDKRDGKIYKTIKIEDQIWMAENLNYDTIGACWCYDNNSINCAKYGRLYNYETAKKIAPIGWHLPTKDEYKILLKNIADSTSARYDNLIVGGSSGFNVRLCGKRQPTGGFVKYKAGEHKTYEEIELFSYFWFISIDYSGIDKAWAIYVDKTSKKVSPNPYIKSSGFSVRYIKD